MEKWMCIGSIGVAVLFFLLFALDIFASFPFGGGPFLLVDIGGALGAGVLAYLGWNAYRDVNYDCRKATRALISAPVVGSIDSTETGRPRSRTTALVLGLFVARWISPRCRRSRMMASHADKNADAIFGLVKETMSISPRRKRSNAGARGSTTST